MHDVCRRKYVQQHTLSDRYASGIALTVTSTKSFVLFLLLELGPQKQSMLETMGESITSLWKKIQRKPFR